MKKKYKLLMCKPSFYGVSYVINPWMNEHVDNVDCDLAIEQWNNLFTTLVHLPCVEEIAVIEPVEGLPDMVFTANAGLVIDNIVVLSNFAYPERQPEKEFYKKWFGEQRYGILELPEEVNFEGAGDALWNNRGDLLWLGYGFRTDLKSHDYLQSICSQPISLKLINPNFYHLDTCFVPMRNNLVMYYPDAFDSDSIRDIEGQNGLTIPIGDEDAHNFACNALNLDKYVITNSVTPKLREELEKYGAEVIETPVSEFLKAGGGVKCLVLEV